MRQRPLTSARISHVLPGALLALFLLISSSALAVEFQQATDYTLEADDTLSKELWLLTANRVLMKGTAKDDCFILTQAADLAGTFENDLWALGDAVHLDGSVRDHARLVGDRVTVNGFVASGLAAAGNEVSVSKRAWLGGDALLVGENVLLEGRVEGDATLMGSQVTMGGTVDGSVRLIADDIRFLPNTTIGGDLFYTSEKELIIDPETVHLAGELVRKDLHEIRRLGPPPSAADRAANQAFFFLATVLAGAVWMALAPRTTGRAVRLLRQATWRCALSGAIAFCIIPMAAFFLGITVIGLPLSAILMFSYVVMVYLAKVVAGVALGAAMLKRRGPQSFGQTFTTMACGLFVIYLVAFVPMVSMGVWFAATVLGLGGLVLSLLASESRLPAAVPPVGPAEVPPMPGGTNSNPSAEGPHT